MRSIEISGRLTTRPQFSKKESRYAFGFEYEPKRISQALALARPPIPTIIEFSVVVPEHLSHKVVGLNVGDACVLVYPENRDGDNRVSPVDILVK